MKTPGDEIEEVFERMGSPLADFSREEMCRHAANGMAALTQGADVVGRAWKPESNKLSDFLRHAAEIAEIGERYVEENAPDPPGPFKCARCGDDETCGDPPGSDCHS